jgi:hypothetical protein
MTTMIPPQGDGALAQPVLQDYEAEDNLVMVTAAGAVLVDEVLHTVAAQHRIEQRVAVEQGLRDLAGQGIAVPPVDDVAGKGPLGPADDLGRQMRRAWPPPWITPSPRKTGARPGWHRLAYLTSVGRRRRREWEQNGRIVGA